MLNVVFDANIVLKYLKADMKKDSDILELVTHINSNCNDICVVLCNDIIEEINNNIPQLSLYPGVFHYHFRHPLERRGRLKIGNQIDSSEGCQASHTNDQHLILCALGEDCKYIVTKDERLTLEGECQIEKISPGKFYDIHLQKQNCGQ